MAALRDEEEGHQEVCGQEAPAKEAPATGGPIGPAPNQHHGKERRVGGGCERGRERKPRMAPSWGGDPKGESDTQY